jgi:DNA-binding GntR family transcriptional regulator
MAMEGATRQAFVPPPERNQLRHSVAATIRELIISGQAPPGDLLRLAPLAEQMDMSITPVREALLLLAQEGWVVQEPNRGFRVLPIRRNDVEDTYFVHQFVAGELAARAAANATGEQVALLRALDEQINDLADDADIEAERLNYELHQQLYDIAESPRLGWFVVAASRFVPRQFWGTIPGWRAHNRTGHKQVIDMLENKDREGARLAMSAHIHNARILLLNRLDSIDFWA